jgi:5'-3' exonuclease
MNRLLLDCSCLCYKSLYTMGDLSQDQKRVGVVFGFVKQILSLAKKLESNRFVFCWDSRNSYRKVHCSSYKAKRRQDQTPEQMADMADAFRQFDEIREILLPAMGFKNIFQQSGYEADDLIANLSINYPEKTIIVSTDNDMLQCISDRTSIYNFKETIDVASFKRAWFDLDPIQWITVKSIAGCSSDEIKGIMGVGEQTAAKYLAGLIKGKKLEKIVSLEGKEIASKNEPLISLPYRLGAKPIKIPEFHNDEISEERFQSIFGQYGFKSLLKEDEILKRSLHFFRS